MRSSHEWLREIGRVLQRGRNEEVGLAVRFRHPVEVFGEHSIGAVWHSVLAQVSGFHPRRNHFKTADGRLSARGRQHFPGSLGKALPAAALSVRGTEV